MIKLYNTLTRKIEDFVPINAPYVSMYTCGPTVYNYAHIGNLRTYVSEDILLKTLESAGFQVDRVLNITDVGHLTSDSDDGDDKMLSGAIREKKTVWEIAQFYTQAFFKDILKLQIRKPDKTPKATDFIKEYIDFIKRLEAKGYTYFANGNVYFDISKFPDYTNLSRMDLSMLSLAHRDDVSVDTSKKNPSDFVLWFTKSKFEDQAMKWDSPWGVGYPGWHIECSVISLNAFGERLDIHCGGVDHIPIHHSNEIAQTESFTGSKWCNYWWHAEFLLTDGDKMSKSSGEFLTLSLLESKGFEPLSYRYYLLGSHYRRQLSFTFENLRSAQIAYFKLLDKTSPLIEAWEEYKRNHFSSSVENAQHSISADNTELSILGENTELSISVENAQLPISNEAQSILDKFYQHLYNDLGTANALTEVYNLLKSNTLDWEKGYVLSKMDEILSLNLHINLGKTSSIAKPSVQMPDNSLNNTEQSANSGDGHESNNSISISEIEDLITKRAEAKKIKDFNKADSIRNLLREKGIELIDTKEGTSWKKI